MGCGAVLDHFRVAMAAAGWTANVDRFPNPNNRLHVASVDFSRWSSSPTGTAGARTPFCCGAPIGFPSPLRPTGIRSNRQLRDTVTSDAVRLDVIPDDLRPQLAEASQLTESLRLYDSSYHAELALVDSSFRGLRGHSAQLTGVGGRKRPRRRRTHLPGDPSPRAAPGVDEDHSKIAGVVDLRRYTRQCAAVRRDAFRRTARRHDGRAGHLHADPHHRIAGEPRDRRRR